MEDYIYGASMNAPTSIATRSFSAAAALYRVKERVVGLPWHVAHESLTRCGKWLTAANVHSFHQTLLVPTKRGEAGRINRAAELWLVLKLWDMQEQNFSFKSQSRLSVPVPALLSTEFRWSTVIKNLRSCLGDPTWHYTRADFIFPIKQKFSLDPGFAAGRS